MEIEKDWYVIYVKPRSEKKINKVLVDTKIKTFLPLVDTRRKWSDRIKTVSLPLFPSYIFVCPFDKNELYSILAINGVYTYLKFGSDYAIVSNAEIKKIKAFLDIDGLENVEISTNAISQGELRRFDYGPFVGLNCFVVKANHNNKIIVKIESIKKNIIATVASKYLSTYSTRIGQSPTNNIRL